MGVWVLLDWERGWQGWGRVLCWDFLELPSPWTEWEKCAFGSRETIWVLQLRHPVSLRKPPLSPSPRTSVALSWPLCANTLSKGDWEAENIWAKSLAPGPGVIIINYYFPDRAKCLLYMSREGRAFCSLQGGPDSLILSPFPGYDNNTSAGPAHAMPGNVCLERGKESEGKVECLFPLPPVSVGDTGEKRAADPGLNLECSLIRYYAICSRTLSPSNAAANLLSSPN